MKRNWKIILVAVLAVVVAGILAFQYLEGIRVEVYRVGRYDLVESFTEEGVLVSEDERTVYSLYQAGIEEVLVEEGDEVEDGDLLVVLDAEELELKLSELRSQLRAVNSEIAMTRDSLETAEDNYERIEVLYQRDWATKIELEEAEKHKKEMRSAVESLESQRSAISAQVQTVEHRKDNYRIKAPIAGVVVDLNAEEKGVAGAQLPLMRLLKKNEVEQTILVETRVLTRDVEEIHEGQQVEMVFERRDEDLKFSGEVEKIASYAEKDISPLGLEEERVTVTIDPDLNDEINLGPGYKVDVEFVISVVEDALLAPGRALFTYEGEDALMVVRDNRARVRKVAVGAETRQEAEITEGINEGDLVILDPGVEGLEDGRRVFYDTD